MVKMTLSDAAKAVAACGGYSEDRYRSWVAVAKMLLRRGYTPIQAEAIMRSKWTRWASDQVCGVANAKHLEAFLDDRRNQCDLHEVADLVRQTPSELPENLQKIQSVRFI